jgi:hypothetical protein
VGSQFWKPADLAWARLTSVSEQTRGPISDELVFALRADFAGDEATVNAALALVTVAPASASSS